MSKTIKQLADELGVSKQAVMKRIDNLGLRSKLAKNGNQYLIDDTTEKLIKSGTLKQLQSTPSSLQLVSTLQSQVDTLKQQLDVKDEQIRAQQGQIAALQAELERERQHSREQSDKLAALSETVGNSLQQLTTGQTADKNKQLVDTMLQAQQSIVPSKRHWWQRRTKGE